MFDEVPVQDRPSPDAPPASTLARHSPRAAPSNGVASREYLTFRVGSEDYAIDILRVQEIRGYSAMTRIAHAPASVKGVVNLRGLIVPVVDLRLCLHTDGRSRDEDTVTIVLDLRDRVVGMMVDGVSDVLSLDASDIRPAPQMRQTASADTVLGIACLAERTDRSRMLVVLDIERLLSDTDIGL